MCFRQAMLPRCVKRMQAQHKLGTATLLQMNSTHIQVPCRCQAKRTTDMLLKLLFAQVNPAPLVLPLTTPGLVMCNEKAEPVSQAPSPVVRSYHNLTYS